MKKNLTVFIPAIIACTLTACRIQSESRPTSTLPAIPTASHNPVPTATTEPTPDPPRVLTICSQEPASLFLYGDTSSAARGILQAVYDGPFDVVNYEVEPVILEKVPTVDDGDVFFKPVEVVPGTLIIDALGSWVSLDEGVRFRPSGCTEISCAQSYEGINPVQMDALVVQFSLIPGILWSDGTPLTAGDSVFSFNVLKHLFQNTGLDLIRFTKSYTALDEQTVEWVGIPGYVGNFVNKFSTPLPEHQLKEFPFEDLLTAESTSRIPMGWGPYILDEWVVGDHITLSRNPNYFRAVEGLPKFDHLVYRFMSSGDEAIDALVIGECDFIDRTVLLDTHLPRLETEQEAGNLVYSFQTGTGWELAAFGIQTLSQRYEWFGSKEVRQAIAMCIDRDKIVDELLYGVPQVPDTYVPSNHPYFESTTSYSYDPEAAGVLLTAAGWIDHDNNPQTPRVSNGLANIPDGTSLVFNYLVPSDAERPETAKYIKNDLAGCGIEVEINPQNWESLMTPGPEGLLFGRKFEMAQFAWSTSIEPPCRLFMSEEIPGPYPEFPKGWGGANLSGYSSTTFDEACLEAMSTLPGSDANLEAHHTAQEIFADELPVLPLYQRIHLVAMRVDLCEPLIDPAGNSALSHLEEMDYGEVCE